ncbi:hypothetical protein PPTG_19315 [Phytophthora nicotianae INRA-310]|uniref:Uncharacterized protein n=4 Tax=Phytophthora nicotianae TaxID=4792 RepID=W2PFG3_PHYN3|nr:hypothetical protein PPTG_19315 [Phytophthora nicotianae INRA-310]ETM98754.1 hypothetical protein PPTG_19315 [Phytophthora nicotianae INRA-310]KUF76693.1 hypothetical protein AM587_10003647 [Phytophthora nicotianae]KUF78773.1 hypothetical protein AM587_10000330 [Phytophthora nicotianae]KUF82029.1 hypothetical protein AM587_10002126 [Phytophthora nicotianae]
MPTVLSKRGRVAAARPPAEPDSVSWAPQPAEPDSNHLRIASVTKPPSSLGLPSYYTQYEEDRSNTNDKSSSDESGASPPYHSPPDTASAAKRPRVATDPANLVDVAGSDGNITPARHESKTRKVMKAKTTKPRRRGPATTKKKKPMSKSSPEVFADAVTPQPTSDPPSLNSGSKKKAKTLKTKKSSTTGKTSQQPAATKSMKWTVQLTAIAIEARYRNKRILKKFSTKNSNTKAQRAMWEDTINVFQERALAEQAWGDKEPRTLTVKQFKNKLDSVRSNYKAKRQRMMATGNRSARDGDDSDDKERQYPEMPNDFLIDDADEHSDESFSEGNAPRRSLACDPMNVNPSYRSELGADLAALWPLLCEVFSRRPGCTGEAITETGIGRVQTRESDSETEVSDEQESDTGSSESPSEAHQARERAKAVAKAKKRRDTQVEQPAKKRPADAVSDTLRSGFEAIERVFSNRHQPSRPSGEMTQLFGKLASSIEATNAQHQATSEALLRNLEGLHQLTASLFREVTKRTTNSPEMS